MTPIGRIQRKSLSRVFSLFVCLLYLLPLSASADPSIRLRTSSGDVFINLTPTAAPGTVANFLEYIDNGDFINSFFHDSQQTGGLPKTISSGKFRWGPGNFNGITDVRIGPTIANEFNQSNARGTVAMTRIAGSADSATNSWFINVADNGGSAPTGLDFVDGGSTVFGTINAASMEVVDVIAALTVEDQGNDLPALPVLTPTVGSLFRNQVVRIESHDSFESISAPASAVLPLSRAISSVGVASGFATIANSANSVAASCRMRPSTSVPAEFSYRQTDPATNAPVGDLNPLLDIPAAGFVTLVFTLTPTTEFDATTIEFDYLCGNADAGAAVTAGVNTFALTSSATPIADIVAIAGTAENNGINDIPAGVDSGAFVVATSNLGSTETIIVSANTGGANLPVSLFLCPTNATTGQCQSDPAVTVTETQPGGGTTTYAVFAQLTQSGSTIAFEPAVNRAFVEFRTLGGALRGSTSVALRTVR